MLDKKITDLIYEALKEYIVNHKLEDFQIDFKQGHPFIKAKKVFIFHNGTTTVIDGDTWNETQVYELREEHDD